MHCGKLGSIPDLHPLFPPRVGSTKCPWALQNIPWAGGVGGVRGVCRIAPGRPTVSEGVSFLCRKGGRWVGEGGE